MDHILDRLPAHLTIQSKASLKHFFIRFETSIPCCVSNGEKNQATNLSLFIGLTDQPVTIADTDTPIGSGNSGFLFANRDADSTYQIIRNDGTATALVSSTGISSAADTDVHTIEIIGSSTNMTYSFDG